MSKAVDMDNYFKIPMDNRDLNYDNFYKKGTGEIVEYQAYDSDNTYRLDTDEMIELLIKMGETE